MANALPTLRFLLHLAAFSQLGILTRIVIGRLFGGSCAGTGHWDWAPCVTGSGLLKPGGTLFYDFPSNVLGSFFIGLLTAGSVLETSYPQHIVPAEVARLQLLFLHHDSSLQGHSDLQIGLRTGYCGSLTTFSSWLLQVVILMVGRGASPGSAHGTQWVQGLWSLFLGVAGPLTALVVGQHTALAAAAAWQAAGPACAKTAAKTSVKTTASSPSGIAAPDAAMEKKAEEQQQPPPPPQQAANVTVVIDNASSPPQPPPAPLSPPPPPSPPALSLSSLLVDAAAAAVLLTLTGVSAAYAYLDRDGPHAIERRFWWFSLLFGPPACLLRWYLSRFNTLPAAWARSYRSRHRGGECDGGKDGGGGGCLGSSVTCGAGVWACCSGDDDWGWLHLGTFGANVAACALNFAAQAILYRLGSGGSDGGGLSGLQRVALLGLMVGSAGSLSTVSTWVAELQKLSVTAPVGAYKYGTLSLGVPVVLGLLVYGIPAWTA